MHQFRQTAAVACADAGDLVRDPLGRRAPAHEVQFDDFADPAVEIGLR